MCTTSHYNHTIHYVKSKAVKPVTPQNRQYSKKILLPPTVGSRGTILALLVSIPAPLSYFKPVSYPTNFPSFSQGVYRTLQCALNILIYIIFQCSYELQLYCYVTWKHACTFMLHKSLLNLLNSQLSEYRFFLYTLYIPVALR